MLYDKREKFKNSVGNVSCFPVCLFVHNQCKNCRCKTGKGFAMGSCLELSTKVNQLVGNMFGRNIIVRMDRKSTIIRKNWPKNMLDWWKFAVRDVTQSYILKASLVTTTIPQKNWTFRKFVQKCHKMTQKWPKMTQSGPKWPENDPQMAQNFPKWL